MPIRKPFIKPKLNPFAKVPEHKPKIGESTKDINLKKNKRLSEGGWK